MKLFKFHPGETFVLNFALPFSKYDVQVVVLSFRDCERVCYETSATSFREEEDGSLRVGYLFTQAESLMFDEKKKYKMQLNVYGPNSSRISSKEMDIETLEQQIVEPGYTDALLIDTTANTRWANSTTGGTIVSYNDLVDKPSINDQVLVGDRTLPIRITEEQIDELLLS